MVSGDWVRRGLFSVALVLSLGAHADERFMQASGIGPLLPAPGSTFSEYVRDIRSQLRGVLQEQYFEASATPFGEGVDLDSLVDWRGPYEFRPQTARCEEDGQGMGFLLIHGLTDSPFLLRDIADSLRQRYPCALLRGLLLSGHSTVPGDTLAMRHEDWLTLTQFGVESFRGEVDRLYLVGFSTGTSLSVRYVDAHRDDPLVSGLIMLSPAIKAKSSMAFLSPYVRWFSDWLSQGEEKDYARYESFSVNAGAEFYLLTRSLYDEDFQPLTTPVFMAGSGDDATVDMEAAREFFCRKTPEGKRLMLWYSAQATSSEPSYQCEGLRVLPAQSSAHRVINFSHTSLSISPRNPHYGLDGNYPVCEGFADTPALRTQCQQDDQATVYGERGLGEQGLYNGKLVRRGTFNPYYDDQFESIVRFIETLN